MSSLPLSQPCLRKHCRTFNSVNKPFHSIHVLLKSNITISFTEHFLITSAVLVPKIFPTSSLQHAFPPTSSDGSEDVTKLWISLRAMEMSQRLGPQAPQAALLDHSSICSPRPDAIKTHLLSSNSEGVALEKGSLHKTKLSSCWNSNRL